MGNVNWLNVIPPNLAPIVKSGSDLPLIFISLITLSLVVIGLLVLKYLRFRKSLSVSMAILEIKPPAISLQSAFTTKQLFSILHSIENKPTILDRLLCNKKRISYELVSDKKGGIRYIICLPKEDVSIVRKNLQSYLPGTEITEIDDYIPKNLERQYTFSEIRLKKPYVFPLKTQELLNEHDPISYIAGQMTKLDKDELIVLQLVTSPVTPIYHSGITDYLYTLQKRIYEGKEIISYVSNSTLNQIARLISPALQFLLIALMTLIKDFGSWIMDFIVSSPHYQTDKPNNQALKEEDQLKELTPKQKQIQEMIESKINQDLFEVSARLLVVGDNTKQREKGVLSTLSTYTNQTYQALTAREKYFKSIFTTLNYIKLNRRLFSFRQNMVLSSSELATIYHFPYTKGTSTEDLQSIKSTHLPAPICLKNADNLDNVFGHNIHGESITPIGLTLEERRRHLYVIGATGMGKTTLLTHMIYQDIVNGKGLAVIDPHGDLANKLISIVPEHRLEDVVYFNPYDLDFPVALNVLQMTEGLSDTEKERERDLIVSSLISVFLKLYPSTNSRPRMEHILRNTILTVLTAENPTLLTAYKLLVDKNLRKKLVANLDDELLKEFWEKEFKGFGSYQRAELISPITNKLGRFFTTKTTRNILTQEKNKIDFTDIMNNKKILICDLSKGKIGEDISSFLGSLIILKLQLAALNRVHTEQDKREDFFLYIDEFQNFATATFAQILSEARKYRLNTILAHQTISQIEDKDLFKVILANVGTVISYRTSNPTDEQYILPLFMPEVNEHQIANLPSYNFYIKINSLQSQGSFTGTTDNFTIQENEETKNKVIELSRKKYGTHVNELTSVKIATQTKKSKVKKEPEKKTENKVRSSI